MAGFDLNPAQLQLLSGFVDTYLKLEPLEEERLQEQLDRIKPREKEDVMTIVTSWMQQGIDQGLEKGREEGRERTIATLARQLKRKIGTLNAEVEQRLSQLSFDELDLLGEALFDFETLADLDRWLQKTHHSLDRA
jgi:flagellar biosynthesis/type III secretory pathway protein FliH